MVGLFEGEMEMKRKARSALLGTGLALLAFPMSAQSQTFPSYPQDARRQGKEGITALRMCVRADGEGSVLEVAKSAGHPSLDEAAVEWADSLQLDPAIVNGEPVSLCGHPIEVVWSLGGVPTHPQEPRQEEETGEPRDQMRPFPEAYVLQPDTMPEFFEEIGPPDFPPMAVDRDKAGVLTLDVCIDEVGAPATVVGFGTTGDPAVDMRIIESYARHSFRPARKDEADVAVCGFVTSFDVPAMAAAQTATSDAAPQ